MEPTEPVSWEEGLRRALVAGDQAAWRAVHERLLEPLWAYVHCRAGRDTRDTEDIVQEAWVVAVRRIESFRPELGSLEAWMRGIAENVLRNHARRARVRDRQASAEGLGDVAARPVAEPGVGERIARTLTALPARYQAVLKAKYEEDLAVGEIALRCGESPKAVESLLSRARAAFRELWARGDDR